MLEVLRREDAMYTTERRRMSLHEVKRKSSIRLSAGSLWQDSLALELSANKSVMSPRSRSRALSVVYVVVEDASVPQSEEDLSLRCVKEACADSHAELQTVPFECIAHATANTLDTFYNAGKCGQAPARASSPSPFFQTRCSGSSGASQ